MIRKIIEQYKQQHNLTEFVPKLVLFDMDGVLYNSMPNHARAWVEAMSFYGLDMTTLDAYLTEGQRGTDTIIQMVRAQQGREITEREAQNMYNRKARIFAQLPEAPLMTGILHLMQKIKKSGLKMGIVTGSGQLPLIKRLKTDFKDYVRARQITTAYDVTRGKPHPEPYLIGMRKAKIEHPEEVIVVENAPLGVQAGVASGAFTIGVNTGILPRRELKNAGAHLVFPSMNALADKWEVLVRGSVSQRNRWEQNCQALTDYLEQNHRRPSKHHKDDLKLVNWLKHNRKLLNQGKLLGERKEQFEQLLELCARYQRVNQYAYRGQEEWIEF